MFDIIIQNSVKVSSFHSKWFFLVTFSSSLEHTHTNILLCHLHRKSYAIVRRTKCRNYTNKMLFFSVSSTHTHTHITLHHFLGRFSTNFDTLYATIVEHISEVRRSRVRLHSLGKSQWTSAEPELPNDLHLMYGYVSSWIVWRSVVTKFQTFYLLM